MNRERTSSIIIHGTQHITTLPGVRGRGLLERRARLEDASQLLSVLRMLQHLKQKSHATGDGRTVVFHLLRRSALEAVVSS